MAGVQKTQIPFPPLPQVHHMQNGNNIFVLYKAAMKSSVTTNDNDL